MTKVRILLILLVVAISGIPIPLAIITTNFYAGGPERDYDERYRDAPAADECWSDVAIAFSFKNNSLSLL
jgi:hypothetical protein